MFRSNWIYAISLSLAVLILPLGVAAQKGNGAAGPVVTKIDEQSIKRYMTPDGKPLLVNFWATWCVPCVEEFPLLVQINEEYKGRIDFITISLDYLSEIERDVPAFLKEQKATMPAYLLHTPDENAVISSISENWSGGLPFTVFYGTDGEILYAKQGIVKIEVLKPIVEKAAALEECKPGPMDN